MDQREFAQIAVALQTYYPRENLLPNERALELWFRQLQDLPYNVTELALNKWVSLEKWPPTIADLRRIAMEISGKGIKDWGAAWADVMQAVRDFGFGRGREAFAAMGEFTAEIVRRVGWEAICMSTNSAVERANFRTIYEQASEERRQAEQIPPALRLQIGKMIAGQIEKKEDGGP